MWVTKIPQVIEKTMQRHRVLKDPKLRELLETDRWAREEAGRLIQQRKN